MNNIVRIGGFALIALGVLVILLVILGGGSFEGLTLDGGALLLAGGLVALGLSVLTAAVETLRAFVAAEEQGMETFEEAPLPMARPLAEELSPSPFLHKTRGNSQSPAPRQEPEMASRVLDMPKSPDERISVVRENAVPPLDTTVEDVHDYNTAVQVSDETVSEEELYVVEERTIAGKPARILSDGTVEAETDDGWMRFENVEHLEEYMEAVRGQHG